LLHAAAPNALPNPKKTEPNPVTMRAHTNMLR
jgi:hypothetical protein